MSGVLAGGAVATGVLLVGAGLAVLVPGVVGGDADVGSLSTPGTVAPGPVASGIAAPGIAATLDPSGAVASAPATAIGFVPMRLSVDAVDLEAPLVVTLVDPDGALVPPEDPATLGWWRGVRPGEGEGSVVVAGHLDSATYAVGPLGRVVDLRAGDTAVVSGADGERRAYAVRAVQTIAKEALPAAELFGTRGPERLVLVTCGGSYDPDHGGWDSNVVAVLDPVPSQAPVSP